MYFVYNILSYLVFLFSPIIFLLRILNGKEDIKRFKEKLCIYSKKNNLKSIWFHAVSVGELMSILPILNILEKNKQIDQIIVTSSTISSAKIFEKQKATIENEILRLTEYLEQGKTLLEQRSNLTSTATVSESSL